MPADFSYAATPFEQYDPGTRDYIQRLTNSSADPYVNKWVQARNLYSTDATAENLKRVNDAWTNLTYDFRTGINNRQKNYERQQSFNQARVEADKFRKDRGAYEVEQYDPLNQEAQYGLNQSERRIKSDYNKRGLLGGAQMMGSIISARTQVANQLQKARMQINQEASRIQQGMDNTVANIGLNSFDQARSNSALTYQNALTDALERRAAIGSLFGSLGAGVGSYYGYKNAADQKQTVPNEKKV